MLKKVGRWRAKLAALAVAACLVATGAAMGLGGPFIIVAPSEIVAGNPIVGYVTGCEGPTTVSAWTFGGGVSGYGLQPLGSFFGVSDPLWFFYPTYEMQAPGVVTIQASDFDECATASVILK